MDTPAIKADFIPRQKRIDTGHRRGAGIGNIFFIIAIIVLIAALLGWGGLMVYEYVLRKDKTTLEEELKQKVEASIDTSFIEELEIFDRKIKAVDSLLNNHVDLSLALGLIGDVTLTNSVRFKDFSYSSKEGEVTVTANGTARSLSSLKYQEQVLEDDPRIISPEFTNVTIDELAGSVGFQLVFKVSGNVISYKEKVNKKNNVFEDLIEEQE